ncbi:MAG: hypothetical protein QOG57_4931 [Pseudonocardiales bacterium]|jgi:uncharacterized OB-fold protein|nr:hypothetical protein [Pseudonocardiales bacterium]MDT7668035.1 hypothetical protein [Pseudonocardiales bacterium]MDT7684621.1 hypothetical protein [Pseudonocardiales bacterium]MDT7693882.1 hypothetical protein [Pseudonocardiales bacterium]
MNDFQFDGVQCGCGAAFITVVERCPECGCWDPARHAIAATGTVLAATSVQTEQGGQRAFAMVELAGGLRAIGLTRGDPPLGTLVVAVGEDQGVPVFADHADPTRSGLGLVRS